MRDFNSSSGKKTGNNYGKKPYARPKPEGAGFSKPQGNSRFGYGKYSKPAENNNGEYKKDYSKSYGKNDENSGYNKDYRKSYDRDNRSENGVGGEKKSFKNPTYTGYKSKGGYKPDYSKKSYSRDEASSEIREARNSYNRYGNGEGGGYKGGYKSEGGGYKGGFKSEGGGYKGGFKSEGGSYKGGYKGNRENSYDKHDKYSSMKNKPKFENKEEAKNILPNVPEDELPYIVMGRNAVREALKSGRSIDKLLVLPDKDRDGSLRELVAMARDKNIIIQETDRQKLDAICMPFGHGDKPGNHQGIIARVPGAEYVDISDILEYAKKKNEKPFILLLDGVTDPYNLGSVIRSAECAGVHGIILPKRRSATLTSSVVKVSAGAVDYMRVARVSNIASAIDKLHGEGMWIAGADAEGSKSIYEADMTGAFGLVIGSEGDGLSALVRDKCDYLVNIPLFGSVESLNASVAAAVVMFEKQRQEKGLVKES